MTTSNPMTRMELRHRALDLAAKHLIFDEDSSTSAALLERARAYAAFIGAGGAEAVDRRAALLDIARGLEGGRETVVVRATQLLRYVEKGC